MSIGLLAGFISTVLSVLIGMYPGYRGGWLDRIFDTLTNVFLVIPGLPLIIVISSYVHSTGPWVIVFVIGLTGWAGGARVLRSQTLTYRNRDFISAAKLGGASELRILVWEIIPNMLSLIISNFMFGTLGAILAEAGLEFLGLGNVSVVSWGTMLYWSDSGGALLMGAWWWLLPEGLAIALFGMSLALMNFGIDQLTNPRLRKDHGNLKKQTGKEGVSC
ncbi:ABC transporter permease [Ferroacidibacillus organovorans]|uniref:ABC transporter permease n=1 Tax=Ferroacidibacillus organovorans TaxID=1765683 RepID=UPI001F4207D1|nr:ABC transporter permease [Ferroacidibacillus organovorans]